MRDGKNHFIIIIPNLLQHFLPDLSIYRDVNVSEQKVNGLLISALRKIFSKIFKDFKIVPQYTLILMEHGRPLYSKRKKPQAADSSVLSVQAQDPAWMLLPGDPALSLVPKAACREQPQSLLSHVMGMTKSRAQWAHLHFSKWTTVTWILEQENEGLGHFTLLWRSTASSSLVLRGFLQLRIILASKKVHSTWECLFLLQIVSVNVWSHLVPAS